MKIALFISRQHQANESDNDDYSDYGKTQTPERMD